MSRVLVLALAAWVAFCLQPVWAQETTLRGFVEHLAAFHTRDGSVGRMRPLVVLDLRHRFSEAVALRLAGRFWHDFSFALNKSFPAAVSADERNLAELREAYLDFTAGDFRARLGRQQIVWGEALGSFFTDVVNPKDLREHIFQDLEFTRIPLPAVNLSYSPGDLAIQLIYLPFFEGNRLGLPGAEFPILTGLSGQSRLIQPVQLPERSLTSGSWGLHLSGATGGCDLAVFYLRSFDPMPIYRQIFLPNAIALVPFHNRYHVLGLTMAKALEELVVRLEVVSTLGQSFNNLPRGITLSHTERNTVKGVTGIDYPFAPTWWLNGRLFHTRTLGWTPDILADEQHTGWILRLATSLLERTLDVEAANIGLFDRGDYLVRLKTTYHTPLEGLQISLEWDVFAGDPDSVLFGQFRERNRLALTLRYYFQLF